MKLIIDIPDNTYADIQGHKRYTDFTILDLIKAIKHSTPIPDNAINGDVIKATTNFIGVQDEEDTIKISTNWWNAKYKAESEE